MLEHNHRLQLLEAPGWMSDLATCAAIPLAGHPDVDINRLRALRDLLTSAAGTLGETLLETQHLDTEHGSTVYQARTRVI